jgi:hypothetical protein
VILILGNALDTAPSGFAVDYIAFIDFVSG